MEGGKVMYLDISPIQDMKKVIVFLLYLGDVSGYITCVPCLDYIPVGMYSLCT